MSCSDFSASFCFGLLWLQGFAPFEGLDKVFFDVLSEGLQQLLSCEMGLSGQPEMSELLGEEGHELRAAKVDA